jgi:hypothetical protein
MDRLRRWFLTTTALLLTAGWMPPKKRRTECFISLIGYSPDGTTITVSLTARPAARAKIVQWHLAWGDGQTIQGTGTPPLLHQAHTYATEGDKALTLTVWDSHGGTAGATLPAKLVFRNVNAEQPGGGDPGSDELTWTEAERYTYYCDGGYAGSGTVRTAAAFTDEGIQAQVDASTHGDIVCLPGGTYTVNTQVTITNKDIFVLGAGTGVTNLNVTSTKGFVVGIENAARGAWRISGLSLNTDVVDFVFEVSASSLTSAVHTGRWRVDHVEINPTNPASRFLFLGVTYGLIDHFTMVDPGRSTVVHVSQAVGNECGGGGSFIGGDFAMRQPFSWGSGDMIFMEDSTLIATSPSDGGVIVVYDITGGGGRAVFRYNDFQGTDIYKHWVRGCDGAGGALEVYSNRMEANAAWGLVAGEEFMRLESGTALVYNNQLVGNWSAGNGAYVILDERRGCGHPENSGSGAGGCGHVNGPTQGSAEAQHFGFCGDGGEPATNTDPGPQTDSFTGTGALSGSWTTQVGTPARVSDKFKGGSAGHNYAFYSGFSWPATQRVKATIQGSDLTDVGLMLRASGTGGSAQGYFVGDGPSGAGIYKIAAGAFTLLQAFADTFTTGDVISADATSLSDAAINVYKNDVHITGAFDGGGYTTGSPGLYVNGTTATLDGFVANSYGRDFLQAGSHPWDGNTGDPDALGWPCLNQIGRNPYVDITGYSTTLEAFQNGVKQTSLPFTMWNNGTGAGCLTGGTCTDISAVSPDPTNYILNTNHPNGQKDYQLLGTTPLGGYTPYTYPHPLQSQAWS